MNWKPWLRMLAAALITGAVHGLTGMVAAVSLDPAHGFNLQDGLRPTLQLALASGVLGGLMSAGTFLMKSPLPE